MRKFTLSVLFFTFYSVLYAQIGVFRTYEDYLNNKVVKEYSGYYGTGHFANNFKVVFLDQNGDKVKIKVDRHSMWGYRRGDGKVFRVNEKNIPYVVIQTGKLVLYGNYTTKFTEDGVTLEENQFGLQVSLGLDSEMVRLTKRKLRKLLIGDDRALRKIDQMKSVTSLGKLHEMVDFIIAYNNSNGI